MSMVKQIVPRTDEVQQAHAWLAFPLAVGKKFGDDQAGNPAALIAYYAFFAIFPLLLVLVTVLDIVLKDHPGLRQSLLDSALSQYPVIGPQLGLNTAWQVPIVARPGFPWATLRSFGVFWLAFRLGTARGVGWRPMWLGAAISAVIWQVLQSVGGYFVSHQLAHASPTHGTFAIVIGLLGWLYLQAELTLFAVEINVVRALRLWPRSLAPPPYTEPDRRAYQLYAEATRRGEGLDIVVEGSSLGGEDHPQETSS